MTIENDNNAPCDVDDLLCQIEALGHLKGLRQVVGEDKFKESFPDLASLGDRLDEKISSSRTSLEESLKKCGLPSVEDLGEIIDEPQPAESD